MTTHRRPGFTLPEMLIVICVLGILAAISLPNIRAATDRANATALLERVRVVRTAVFGEESLVPDSLNAPAGTVPAPLRDALADSVLQGEAAVTLQLSGTGREIWVTLHAPAGGRGALVLERAYAEAQREGLAVTYQGPVLQIALNSAAAATVPASAAGAPTGQSAATAAQPAVATAQPSPPPQSPTATAPATQPSPTSFSPPQSWTPATMVEWWTKTVGVQSCGEMARRNVTIQDWPIDDAIAFCRSGIMGTMPP